MCNMKYKEQAIKLAGPIALLKLQSTRMAHYVSDEACQIFGGRGITKTGMGNIIEAFQRTYKVRMWNQWGVYPFAQTFATFF